VAAALASDAAALASGAVFVSDVVCAKAAEEIIIGTAAEKYNKATNFDNDKNRVEIMT
jgi:hypothetical protein